VEWEVCAVAEIAEFLGVSKARVYQLVERDDFPEPIAWLAVGRIWRTADIRAWQSKRRDRIAEDEQR
jgi:predicted DNA-binding transcriptional regulator AlpA